MSVFPAPDAAMSPAGPQLGLPTSEPIVFDTFVGTFQAAPGGTGHPVLMLSPFGYEELCGRTFWTALSDRLAAAGIPSLRFDYPGTANALDPEPDGIDDWRVAAQRAGEDLRRRSGHDRIVVLGQGIGATLALRWAADLGPLDALVLLEPAAAGRTYLRGLKAWGATIATASSLPADAAARDAHDVAGFPVPEARATAIRALDLAKLDLPQVPAILVMEQPGGSVGKLLLNRCGASGTSVVRHDFPGYADLNTDPTAAQIPMAAMAAVVDWLAARPTHLVDADDRTEAAAPAATLLRGEGFAEQPIRFGGARILAGTICRPETAAARGSAVVLVNAGRDHSSGWARSATLQARALARQGITSLRFDLSGVGDSRPPEGPTEELLYSNRMCDDVRTAVNHLEGLGFGSIGLVGRCSGAWAAFTVAVDDPRIDRVALVNIPYFLWDSSKSLADVIRFSQRNVGDLGATLLRRNGFRRLLKGQLDWRGAFRFLLRQANLHLVRRHAPLLGRLTAESRRYHDLHALFGRLKARNVRLMLAYAEGDASLDELRSFMGRDLKRLRRYPDVSIHSVAGADHNFTPAAAGGELLGHLLALFCDDAAPRGREGAEAVSGIPRAPAKSYVLLSGQT